MTAARDHEIAHAPPFQFNEGVRHRPRGLPRGDDAHALIDGEGTARERPGQQAARVTGAQCRIDDRTQMYSKVQDRSGGIRGSGQ